MLPLLFPLGIISLSWSTTALQDNANSDHKKIQGTWQVVSQTDGGSKVPDRALKRMKYKWVITKDRITLYKFEKKREVFSYKLDSGKKPKWIDLTEPPNRRRVTNPGIYELMRDTLKICIPEGQMPKRSAE